MNFNNHSRLEGEHAFLGASKYHWINYDDEKLALTYSRHLSAQRGTKLHDLARDLIALGVKLPRTEATLNRYVNDAIGFQMTPEQPLYYSDNCFGTADAISFKKKYLRIHDLKTGETKTSMNQLFVYTALFCLEYGFKPTELDTELRIYQLDDVNICFPEPDVIFDIMEKIVRFDQKIEHIKLGG